MRRRILGIVIVVFLVVGSLVGLAWWQPGRLFLALAAVSPEIAIEFMRRWIDWRMTKMDPEEQKRNLETEVIRVELEGRLFNVPLRYMYAEAIEKRSQWPKAKPGRVKVGALSLSMLLPDLKPYFIEDDARWKVRGWGDRIEVDIAKDSAPGWFQYVRDRYFSGQEEQFYKRKGVVYGLVLFSSNGYLSDTYFPTDDVTEAIISCDKEPKSTDFFPSCSVKSNYRQGIILRYVFSRDYLPNWREIDQKLKALFDQFEQAAQTESVKQGG